MALALGGGGASYYVIKKQARKAKNDGEKALVDGDAKLAKLRLRRGDMIKHKVLVIKLESQNSSGVYGEAWIEDAGKKAKVTIKLDGPKSAIPEPAHIHIGACPNPDAIKYPLTGVLNGNSVTQLDVSIEEIMKNLPLAINIHKSTEEAKTYIACGDIPSAMLDKGEAMKNEEVMKEKDKMMNGENKEGGVNGMAIGQVKTYDLKAQNFSFSTKEIRVKKGEKVKINVESVQGYHDLVIDEFGARTKQVNTGEKASVEFTVGKTGIFEYYCSVGSHRQMGMVGKLVVE